MKPPAAIRQELTRLKSRRSTLALYQTGVVLARDDQHGVADAAMDIRETDAGINALEWVLEEVEAIR